MRTFTTATWAAGKRPSPKIDKPTVSKCLKARRSVAGHTFLEAIFVVVLLGLIISVAAVNIMEMIPRVRLDEDVARFARTMRTTAAQAVLRGTALAVVIEVTDGYYTVYEANEENRYSDELEAVIDTQSLDRCYVDQIDFEDGSHQYSGELIIRATPQGWGGSLVFNLLGVYDRQRFVRFDRLTTRVLVSNQPLYLLEPQTDVSMSAAM